MRRRIIPSNVIAKLAGLTCKISLINGTAFITYPSVDLTPYVGNKITLVSGGKTLTGWIKAAGSGETLAEASNVSNCINSPLFPFDTFGDASPTGFSAVKNTTGTKRAGTADEIVVVTGELWKLYCFLTVNSGSVPLWAFRTSFGGTNLSTTLPTPSAGANTIYRTTIISDTGVVEILATSNVDFVISNLAVQKVLTPSATGVTIVNAKGGTTFNWLFNSGIDTNATSFAATITRN